MKKKKPEWLIAQQESFEKIERSMQKSMYLFHKWKRAMEDKETCFISGQDYNGQSLSITNSDQSEMDEFMTDLKRNYIDIVKAYGGGDKNLLSIPEAYDKIIKILADKDIL